MRGEALNGASPATYNNETVRKWSLTGKTSGKDYLSLTRQPKTFTRAKSAQIRRQFDEIRAILGDRASAELVGISELSINRIKHYPGTLRAIQFLHALLFRQGQTVQLADILTSFRYAIQDRHTPQSPSSCGGGSCGFVDGDGI